MSDTTGDYDPDYVANGRAEGLVEPGNIDLTRRPRSHNEDGSISTVRSLHFGIEGGRAAVVPTIGEDGGTMTPDQAIQQYRSTGRHLGIFASPDHADLYARDTLHNQQAEMLKHPRGSSMTVPGSGAVRPSRISKIQA